MTPQTPEKREEQKRIASQWRPGGGCPFCGAVPTVRHRSKHKAHHTTQNFACKRHWVTLPDSVFGGEVPDSSEIPPEIPDIVTEVTEPDAPLVFDPEQRAIIEAAGEARLIVNAPPG